MNKEDTIKLLDELKDKNPKEKILLHVCCGPCMSGVYEQLSPYFDVVALYFNPNIYPKEEYELRYQNLVKLSEHFPFVIIKDKYDESLYLDKVKGLESEKEGGKRCFICYKMRLEEAAKYAKENGYKYFTSTLSVSPYKNAEELNEIGEELEKEYGITYLYSNFKKHEGYKKSIVVSNELGLYRQKYCGCRFSLYENKEH